MEQSSNIFRFNKNDPFENWTTKNNVLIGYYPRNSLINSVTQKHNENGLGIYNTYCVIRSNVKTISRNCFRNNTKFRDIILSEGIESIEEYAFYNIKAVEIGIPNSVKHIRKNSFSKDITLFVYKDSYAEKYAIKNGFKCQYYVSED